MQREDLGVYGICGSGCLGGGKGGEGLYAV